MSDEPESFSPKKAFSKFRQFLDTPAVRDTVAVGRRALEVAAHLGQANLKGPLAAAGAAMGLAEIVLGGEERDTYELARDRTRAAGLHRVPAFFEGLLADLFERGWFDEGEVLLTHGSISIRVREYEGVTFGIALESGKFTDSYGPYASSVDFREKLLRLFFADIEGDVLMLRGTPARNAVGTVLRVRGIPGYKDLVYAGSKDPKDFAENFRKAREHGLTQAFFLTGAPGAGKTSFTYLVARTLGGRTLVLEPSLFAGSDNALVESVLTAVKLFSPAVVLLDDVDNIASGGEGGRLLTFVDRLRRENPDVLLMSATNYPERILPSMRRPGRLGRRLHFDAPGLSDRVEIIKAYSKALGLKRDLTYLAPLMQNELFTPDFIKDVCEKGLVYSPDELHDYLDEVLNYLKSLGGEAPQDPDDEEEESEDDDAQ
jgi:hypothetical protein